MALRRLLRVQASTSSCMTSTKNSCSVDYSAIDKSLQRDVDKERLSAEEKQSIIGRIETTTELEALSKASFVIEAVNEDFDVKSEVFRALDRITPPETILASNTSSISITKLAAVTSTPGQSHRHALHESGSGDEAGGSYPWHRHVR